jgi:hypothetical protein
MTHTRIALLFRFACLLLLLVAGCSKESGPARFGVSGDVTFDNQPIESGAISFIPVEGTAGPVAGGRIDDGKYQIEPADGPVPGKYRVEIVATRHTGKHVEAGIAGAVSGPSAMASTEEIQMFIPPQFNKKSILTAEIKEGDNKANFALDAK